MSKRPCFFCGQAEPDHVDGRCERYQPNNPDFEETTMTEPYYEINVVKHDVHPSVRDRQADAAAPVGVISATVLPQLAGDILRATADQIAPKKPVTR
ncbi:MULTISPECIES: hypothetical protein [unclassified Micromonospora]|uniref:hypothetical protein n=1 Tax=unclassified Micromonospora TaxID=2617518 RepID=UPI0033C7F417